MEIRVNYANSFGAPNGANWNILGGSTTITDLIDFDTGSATTIDLAMVTDNNDGILTIGAGGTGNPGTGAASWVDDNATGTAWKTGTAWTVQEFRGLDPAKVYTIEAYGLASSGGPRQLDTRVNGGAIESIADVTQNFTEITQHAGISPDGAGTIVFEFRDGGGGSYIGAIRIFEVATASVSITGPLQPGASISGTYSNFTGVPTALTLTDSNSNSISSATEITDLVITDNGDGTGSFTFTMPALPTAGNSQNSLLFGDITAELTT